MLRQVDCHDGQLYWTSKTRSNASAVEGFMLLIQYWASVQQVFKMFQALAGSCTTEHQSIVATFTSFEVPLLLDCKIGLDSLLRFFRLTHSLE
jgi:hypothetical protein